MPTFQFQGRDLNGVSTTGKRLAQSADTLGDQLMKEGITPISITILRDKENYWQKLSGWFEGKKVTLEDLGIFSRQMYTLCKTGVPITIALRQLADNARSTRMTMALQGVIENLESGLDLATSMQRYPNIFTPLMVSMIRVGQNSGQLDQAFLRLNEYIELETSAVKQIKTIFRYPIFVLTVVVTAIIVLNIFVIPTFSNIFSQSNVSLPVITIVLIAISNFFVNHWKILLIAFIALSIFLYRYLKKPEIKIKLHQYLLKIPVFGLIMKRVILLRFAKTFAITVRSGIPLLDGIKLVAKTMNNTYARQQILSMQDAILHGKNLSQAAYDAGLFTSLELQMMAVSEKTGDLPEMLEQVAAFYQRELEYDLKRLTDIIEPILLIMLSLMILILAFAIYLPIWDMIKLVHS